MNFQNLTFNFMPVFMGLLLIIVGYFVGKLASNATARLAIKKLNSHQTMLAKKIIFYCVFVLFFVNGLQLFGFKLSVLLGATGLLTIAIGFAAQTSVSNLISGLFLLAEKPFSVGDEVTINDISGEVLSIDILSVKLRTSDNTLVRIPNETLIKTSFVNISWFPNRRFDLIFPMTFKLNFEKLKSLLLETAQNNSYVLTVPAPQFQILGFGEGVLNVQLSVWSPREYFSMMKSTIIVDVLTTLEKNRIDIPFPSRTIYQGKMLDCADDSAELCRIDEK